MPARPAWKGQLRLALVSIPVEIYAAARSTPQVEFRQIHRGSGRRIRYEKMVPGIGPIKPEDIARGFEIGRDEYVLLDDADLDALRLASRRTLELTQFVDSEAIDPIYFERPFYVVPADELAEEAYVVLREALKASGKLGLGQLAMRGREHVVALKPCGRGLLLETLRYADELNRAQSYFRDIDDRPPDRELLDLATTLIGKRSGAFEADAFRDHYVEAVKALVEKKRKGHVIRADDAEPAKGAKVIDLMAALKQSVGAGGGAKQPAKSAPNKPAPKKGGRAVGSRKAG